MKNIEAPRIIISGGGTGGHIFPAISIANALKAKCPNAEILFVGAEGRMEMTRVPEAGYEIEGLPVRGLIRPLWSPRNIGVMIDFFRSRSMVKKIIKDFKPHIAIGVGGYASAPTLNAAAAMGVPCLIQEQNSYAGVTNKSLAQKAQKICVAYDGMERFFPADKIIKTGNPVRQSLITNDMTKREARISMGLDPDTPTILVIGGSLGARTINNAIADGISRFDERHIQVILQTGKYYAEDCEKIATEHYKAAGDGTHKYVCPRPFISDMATAYKATDIVISRAGASSISELCLLGKAAVLVPSPNVAEDHQTKNARALSDRGAAVLVADNEAAKVLVEQAIALVSDTAQIQRLETEIKKLAIYNSADIIADESLKLINS